MSPLLMHAGEVRRTCEVVEVVVALFCAVRSLAQARGPGTCCPQVRKLCIHRATHTKRTTDHKLFRAHTIMPKSSVLPRASTYLAKVSYGS